MQLTRRRFVGSLGWAGLLSGRALQGKARAEIRIGLVTYLWGAEWDLPTLLRNCRAVGFEGVELRVGHAHGVEPNLSPAARKAVRQQFADHGIVCVGYGSNQEFHSPDREVVERNIAGTIALIRLCHDIGATGVKVKPNALPDGVPPERTIAQIARALDRVGQAATDYGQLIRVEVHGRGTAQPRVMREIMRRVESPAVRVCWNCNPQDLEPPGLAANFAMLRPYFGDTLHIHELDRSSYPYPWLFRLLRESDYTGWLLFEGGQPPPMPRRLAGLRRQVELLQRLLKKA
ncbi:MAG: hypothetical protein Kow00109_25400 [Acidobacteriota bacterium]